MKSVFFIILLSMLFLISAAGCRRQIPENVKDVLDTVVDHAESASMYRNAVDWDVLRSEVYALAEDADSIAALAPAIVHLLESLGDEHGRFFHNNRPVAFYNGPEKAHLKTLDGSVYNDIQQGQVYSFHAEQIAPGVGYVRIVGLPMGDNQQMAHAIQSAVCTVKENGAKDWIVDLRYNGGGNMHPMVEGLTSIIGNGPAGGAVGLTEAENAVWRVEEGDFFYDEQSVQLGDDCMYAELPGVAVLTSMYTASSGEVVAVVFKGREKTRFFGEPTLGLTTVNDWTELETGTALLLSVSTYQDRNGIVYTDYVDADEYFKFIPGLDLNKDPGVMRALEWLSSN